MKMDNFVLRSDAYDPKSSRKIELDKCLAKMVSSDIQPFSIVDDNGFKNFIKLLDPKYILPSRTTLQNVVTKNLYEEALSKLKGKLSTVQYCSLTTDCWTSRSNASYLTLTCHFIENFELKTVVLATQPLLDQTNHCSDNIAGTIKAICMDFDIFNKVVTIVTDNAASMKKACENLQKKHLGCFAHSLNLIVQSTLALNDVQDVLKSVKSIVTYFKSSAIAYAKLRAAQGVEKPLNLIQEVPTRWNSAFYMLKRILLVREAVCGVLLKSLKAPLPLSEEQFSIIQDICTVLEPFETATVNTSAAKKVTVSLIIPTVQGLLIQMDTLKPQMKTSVGADTCLFLTNQLRSRLYPYESRTATRMTTILDPRFKKEGFYNPMNAEQAVAALENDLTFVFKDVQNQCPNEEPAAEKTHPSDLYGFMAEKVKNKPRTWRSDAIIEMRQYFEQQNAHQKIDPLEYWRVNEVQFSNLAQCALKYLCIPATSTDSERTFSKAGQIADEKRSRLKPKTLNMLLFLQKNQWIIS
nr:zinc finger BED domain-containing protein 4-like isoform X1 [Drosophila suzukii]